jgi:hypothetical protein
MSSMVLRRETLDRSSYVLTAGGPKQGWPDLKSETDPPRTSSARTDVLRAPSWGYHWKTTPQPSLMGNS